MLPLWAAPGFDAAHRPVRRGADPGGRAPAPAAPHAGAGAADVRLLRRRAAGLGRSVAGAGRRGGRGLLARGRTDGRRLDLQFRHRRPNGRTPQRSLHPGIRPLRLRRGRARSGRADFIAAARATRRSAGSRIGPIPPAAIAMARSRRIRAGKIRTCICWRPFLALHAATGDAADLARAERLAELFTARCWPPARSHRRGVRLPPGGRSPRPAPRRAISSNGLGCSTSCTGPAGATARDGRHRRCSPSANATASTAPASPWTRSGWTGGEERRGAPLAADRTAEGGAGA